MGEEIETALSAIEQRLATIEARGTPEQWQQLFNDILNTLNAAGQTASVVRAQHEQIQALADAFTRLSIAVKNHDETSAVERAEIKDLMSEMHLLLGSLLSVVRSQMRHLNDIGRAVGADQAEAALKRLKDVPARDARPEEKE
jgi:hypothetical protein